MAAIGQDLINGVLQVIDSLGVGESPDSDDATVVLNIVNNLIGSWNAAVLKSLNGNFGALPDALNAAVKKALASRFEGLIDQWNALVKKGLSEGYDPSLFTFNPFPGAVLYIFQPLPTYGLFQFHPVADVFTDLSQALALPSGWFRALKYNGAVDAAPIFGRQASQETVAAAQDAKAAILTPGGSAPSFGPLVEQLLASVGGAQAVLFNPAAAPPPG